MGGKIPIKYMVRLERGDYQLHRRYRLRRSLIVIPDRAVVQD